mgnify:CR=1 FL=1
MNIEEEKIKLLIAKVKKDFVPPTGLPSVLVEVSARHLHLSRPDLDVLFDAGYELTGKKPLSQPGQFAAEETVRVAGPRGHMDNVRILGPVRGDTQVELSMTDCFHLGIQPVLKMSGDIEGSPGTILFGPAGHTEIKQGVIVAKRHLHITPSDAENFGLADGQEISVRIDSPRGGILENIAVRVSEKFSTALHLDTDEANALGIKTGGRAEILK